MKIGSILIILIALVSGSQYAVAQTLKIATLVPEDFFWMVEMRAGAKEIRERTDGRVKFRFYGGAVVKSIGS